MDPFLDKNSPAAKPEKEWEGIQTNGFTCPLASFGHKNKMSECVNLHEFFVLTIRIQIG